jgi:hypothetical protein
MIPPMPLHTRRRLLVAAALGILVAAVAFPVAVALVTRGEGLKSRAARITVGMPRELVEGVLGRPVLILQRTGGRGSLLCWVDQFWQVDVLTGPDGRAESVECKPSDSLYRRTVGRLTSAP